MNQNFSQGKIPKIYKLLYTIIIMGKYDNQNIRVNGIISDISSELSLSRIANELAESNRLKRLEIQYMLANHGIDTDMIKNNEELEDKA